MPKCDWFSAIDAMTGPSRAADVHQRWVLSTSAGSRWRAPSSWSTWGIAHRGHETAADSFAGPTSNRSHVSSANGSAPETTMLGRKRCMSNGSLARSTSQSSEAVLVTSTGARSGKAIDVPK